MSPVRETVLRPVPSMTPLEARVAMLGMMTSGLCQDTSDQPRFSTVIITMLGRLVTLLAPSPTRRRRSDVVGAMRECWRVPGRGMTDITHSRTCGLSEGWDGVRQN